MDKHNNTQNSNGSLLRADSDADGIPNYQLLSLNPTEHNYEENALHASIARKTNTGRRASVANLEDVPESSKPPRQRRASLSVDPPQAYMPRRNSLSVESSLPPGLQRRTSIDLSLNSQTAKKNSMTSESSFPFIQKKNSPSADPNMNQKIGKETASPLGSRMDLFPSMNSLVPSRVNSVNNLSFAKSNMNLNAGPEFINPSFLSEIARIFASKIAISVHSKDGIDYPDTFTGVEAIVIFSFLILYFIKCKNH